MAYFDSVADVKALRAALQDDEIKDQIRAWRAVRDRANDDVLNSFAAVLPENVRRVFVPYQSQEPDDEVQARKAILASNTASIEVVAKSNDPKIIKRAQSYERVLEAIEESLFPIEFQLLECDGFLGDGETIIALDKLPAGRALAEYGDADGAEDGSRRRELEQFAESEDPDDDDLSPRARYRDAYRQFGDHEAAYKHVTEDAQRNDGLTWRARIIDRLVFDDFEGPDGIEIGMESGQMALNPALSALEAYGVQRVDNRLVLKTDGRATNEPALAGDVLPDAMGSVTLDAGATVQYTQIRTRDCTVILVEGMPEAPEDGIVIQFDNPLAGRGCGYYRIAGDTKARAARKHRYQPVVLGALVEGQLLSILVSAMLAMAIAEAAREKVIERDDQAPQARGIDAPKPATAKTEQGRPVPSVRGRLVREPSTDIDLMQLREIIDASMERYRSREFFSGSGSTSETGIHLARLQTAYRTKLAPHQAKRAKFRKQVLQDITAAVAAEGRALYVPRLPKDARRPEDGIRVAEILELTPEMARLPVEVIVTIGAESEETKYAAMQVSRAEVQFGARSMTTHMEATGTKDPAAEMKRILRDNTVFQAIGTPEQPGWLPAVITEQVRRSAEEYIASLLPPAPAPPPADPMAAMDPMAGMTPPDPMAGMGAVEQPMGAQPGLVPPPVQGQPSPGGPIPVLSGVGGLPQ